MRNISLSDETPRRSMSNSSSPSSTRATRSLELIAMWNGPPDELRVKIDSVSDWGPFELIEIAPVGYETDGKRPFYCQFVYHGAINQRAHYEENLRSLLNGFAQWSNAFHADEYP